jgi:hypothetical protein
MKSAPQRKQPASEGDTGQLSSAQLMRDMGSTKGFDPIPPDQYLAYRDKRYAPVQRLWAWVLSKTIRHGHRSPYCVDEQGNELWIKHAATDLNMDQANVRHAWVELEREGRVERDGRRLLLKGTVVLPEVQANKRRSEVYINLFPPYLAKQIKRLPDDRREALLTEYDRERTTEAKVMAEAAAGVRSIFDQRKDSVLTRFGVKKIRDKKRRPEESPFVPVIAEFVQRFIQTPASPDLRVCDIPKNGHVQTSASLLPSETEEPRGSAAAALSVTEAAEAPAHSRRAHAAAVGSDESLEQQTPSAKPTPSKKAETPIAETAAAVRRYYWSEGDAFVWGLIAKCRKQVPGATDWQIAASVKGAWRKHRKEQRKAGLFLTTVPEFLAEFVKMSDQGQREYAAQCDHLDQREGIV